MKKYFYLLLFTLAISVSSAYSMGTLPSKAKRLVKNVGNDMAEVTKEAYHSGAIGFGSTFGAFFGAPIGLIAGLCYCEDRQGHSSESPSYLIYASTGTILGGAIGAISGGVLGFYMALLLNPGTEKTKIKATLEY